MLERYFPQGIADGEAFLGREAEKEWLKKNINLLCHTLLIAPRRFGKTSLVLNALNELKIPNSELNFHLIVSAKTVEKKIIDSVLNIINQLVSTPEYKLRVLRSFFSRAKKTWKIGFKDIVGLELEPDQNYSVPDNIYTALQLLDHLLDKKKSKAVIFIDEIQELNQLEENFQIEGALRDFAQCSRRITFIFSGSNRRLLVDMFHNREKPLYELCDQMTLGKIDAETYTKYFNKIAKRTWKKSLPQEVTDAILSITDRHPRRVYNLCFYLWRLYENKKHPSNITAVNEAWNVFLSRRLKNTRDVLSSLSKGQLKILTYIALDHHKELTGQSAQRALGLAGSSVTRFIKVLEEHDYVEIVDGKAYIVDPLIRGILKQYESSILAR